MSRRRTALLTLATAALTLGALPALTGCKSRTVTRVDPADILDLDYRFSDDDARMTAEAMIADALSRPWLENWREANGERPVVIIGTVRNDTRDYIDTKLFTKQIEREFVNSQRIRLVAARDERGELRDERLSMQDWSRPETVKRIAWELGADVMMIGRVGENVQVSRDRNRRVQYYQVNLELIDIESNEKLWIGEKQIEKRVRDRG